MTTEEKVHLGDIFIGNDMPVARPSDSKIEKEEDSLDLDESLDIAFEDTKIQPCDWWVKHCEELKAQRLARIDEKLEAARLAKLKANEAKAGKNKEKINEKTEEQNKENVEENEEKDN